MVAFLSGAFGASGAAWLTHHFTEKRDKAAWEREKEKLKEEFNQQIALYNMQSEDKKRELEQQALEQQRTSVRSSILKGIGDPRALSEIITFQNQMFRRGDGVLETRGSESDGVLEGCEGTMNFCYLWSLMTSRVKSQEIWHIGHENGSN